MSVIFQLFGAEDLKQLTQGQLRDLTDIITEELDRSQDTGLETFRAISRLIQDKHMHKLLGRRPLRTISQPRLTDISPHAMDALRKRVHEVFYQLTQELPSGQSSSYASSQPPPSDLVDQLLSTADLAKLAAKVPTGREILAWALTCELANFQMYEALERIQERTEEKFKDYMEAQGKGRQRPKGPDSLYSPFYSLSPLYNPDSTPPNP
jgi:hypothetical protein